MGELSGVLEFFSGEQRVGIGQFHLAPVTRSWWWDEAVFAIFGYPVGAVEPSLELILSHVPAEEHELVQAALTAAEHQPGPFTWSHRVMAADGETRSILVVGDSTPDPDATRPGTPDHEHIDTKHPAGAFALFGFVIDLTRLRLRAARYAGTDAVDRATTHRAVIEQAKGVLMLAYQLDADAAFALLAWHSQHTNRKVSAIARSVVAAATANNLPNTPLRNAFDRILTGSTPHTAR